MEYMKKKWKPVGFCLKWKKFNPNETTIWGWEDQTIADVRNNWGFGQEICITISLFDKTTERETLFAWNNCLQDWEKKEHERTVVTKNESETGSRDRERDGKKRGGRRFCKTDFSQGLFGEREIEK
jgi:hypothetical protein